jgi:hypothetical protein
MYKLLRRDLMKGAAAVVVAAMAPSPARPLLASLQTTDSPDGSWLAPWHAGSHLGRGWFLHALSGVTLGVVRIDLRHTDGQFSRLHVCRRVGRPYGIVHTAQLDILLMNGAAGLTPSDERLGVSLMTFAREIEREQQKGGTVAAPAGLLSYQERLQQYGAGLA